MSTVSKADAVSTLKYIQYSPNLEEKYLSPIRALISKDLSEPYSIYVYRYFLYEWGDLCFMAVDDAENLIGVVICKLETHRAGPLRGYIAMLAVVEARRGKGIATKLVELAIEEMASREADEVSLAAFSSCKPKLIISQIALETEMTNVASLKLYERLGFLRSKRLHRYYLNGNTAFRLVLYLKEGTSKKPTIAPDYPPDYSVPRAESPNTS